MLQDPYKMVVIGAFGFIAMLVGIFLFKHFFPKRKINYLLLVILFSLLPTISIFRQGVYESGDFSIHIYEAMSFFDNLKQGNIIPRWGGELNATYGYPVFLFAYPLPNYLISLPHFVGLSFIFSLKLFLALAFIFSGISMYYFMREYLKERNAFVAAILYLFSPFHLVDLHFRADIGEVLAYVFIPLCFLFIRKVVFTAKTKWIIFSSLSIAALILSHQAISLAVFPILLAYLVFELRQKKAKHAKYFFATLVSLILGVGLSAYYWLPVLAEKKYTQVGLFPKTVHFGNFASYIFSPWKWGLLFQGPKGELSYIIGYVQLFLIILAIFLIFRIKEKDLKRSLQFFLVVFLILFFMLQKQSSFIWNILPFFNNFQFAYRLLAVVSFVSAVIGGFASVFMNKKILIALVLITIAITMLNWGNRKMLPNVTDAILRKQLPLSSYQGEGNGQSLPIWSVDWKRTLPKSHLEVISGNAGVTELTRTNTTHIYMVKVSSPAILRENTLYFPGWKVIVNNKQIPVSITIKSNPGVISFKSSKGIFAITIKFQNTTIMQIANTFTLLAIIIAIVFLILEKKLDYQKIYEKKY